jgi:hypothetical protein
MLAGLPSLLLLQLLLPREPQQQRQQQMPLNPQRQLQQLAAVPGPAVRTTQAFRHKKVPTHACSLAEQVVALPHYTATPCCSAAAVSAASLLADTHAVQHSCHTQNPDHTPMGMARFCDKTLLHGSCTSHRMGQTAAALASANVILLSRRPRTKLNCKYEVQSLVAVAWQLTCLSAAHHLASSKSAVWISKDNSTQPQAEA